MSPFSVSFHHLEKRVGHNCEQYLWPSSDEPRYTIAMSSSAAFSMTCAACAWAMRFWLQRANRKIRQNNDELRLYYAY
jgi:RNase P subunit RPR2